MGDRKAMTVSIGNQVTKGIEIMDSVIIMMSKTICFAHVGEAL